MEGLIIKNISNDYTVKSDNNTYVCKARGKLKKDKIIPKVGDKVTFDENNNYILKIHKRKNNLIRPSVANIDQALVVTSVKKPDLDTNLLDKLLTIISYNNIEPIICFTKLDLLLDDEKKEIGQRMTALNKAILNSELRLGEAYQIGAAYFRKYLYYKENGMEQAFEMLWDYHLKGLLFEYLRGNHNAKTQLQKLKQVYDKKAGMYEEADTDNG